MPDDYRILKESLPHLLHPGTGIVKEMVVVPPSPTGPDLHHYQAGVRMPNSVGGVMGLPLVGGASHDPEKAIARTIGEAVERYSASAFDRSVSVFGSKSSLGERAVNPRDFALYSEDQYADPDFPYARFEEDSRLHWVSCQRLGREGSLLVPASMVYLPYPFDRQMGEFPFSPSVSTGLAAHTEPALAQLNGLLEVVERDAFCLTWQAKLMHPRIEPLSLPMEAHRIYSAFMEAGYEVNLMHARHDSSIPVIIATLHGRTGTMVPFVVSAACHPRPQAAVLKSLEELVLMEKTMQTIRPVSPPSGSKPDFTRILGFEQQLALWWHPSMAEKADFIIESSEVIPLEAVPGFSKSDPEGDLWEAVSRVETTGSVVLMRDITPDWLAELGFYVTRVLVPGYLLVMPGHAYRCLGGKRLWTVPQRMGYPGIRPSEGDYPVPHPFC